MRALTIIERLNEFGDEIKLVEPMSVEEGKDLLNQLVKVKLGGCLANSFYGLALAVKDDCIKVKNGTGYSSGGISP